MKRVVINADDFGLAEDVNLAIVDCFAAGSLTSTTLMVNMPAAQHAAQLASRHAGLGVGLHFNLTLGRPLCSPERVPGLVDSDGAFVSRSRLFRRWLTGRLRGREVARELQAQLGAMRAMGIEPTHIDSHQHVHSFPPVFDRVAGECRKRTIPLRMPWLLAGVNTRSPGRCMRQWVLARMLARNAHRWRGRVHWNDALGSVFDLEVAPADISLDDYARIVRKAADGVFELMVHPVRSAAAVQGLTRIGELGESEWRLLSQPGLAAMLEEQGSRLCSYRQAFGPPWIPALSNPGEPSRSLD